MDLNTYQTGNNHTENNDFKVTFKHSTNSKHNLGGIHSKDKMRWKEILKFTE